MNERRITAAILDMYNGTDNVGMSGIKNIVGSYDHIDYQVFDVRAGLEFPGLEYDIFVFSGGPGDPLEWDERWTPKFYEFIDILWQYNLGSVLPKPAFFICHSFQMMCHHFGLGRLTARRKRSFGVFRVHMTEAGRQDPLFGSLPDPFFAADSRDYQFVKPVKERFEQMGASILAMEKIRPHVPLDRAVMAVRFSNAWVGTQFHPEADPQGMLHMLESEEGRKIQELKGKRKFDELIEKLHDPAKLAVTYQTLLPSFLNESIARLNPAGATT